MPSCGPCPSRGSGSRRSGRARAGSRSGRHTRGRRRPGCGATKTWVMAGGVYRRAPARAVSALRPRQPASPISGTKTHGPSDRSSHSLAAALDDQQLLLPPDAHRDDEPAAVGELLAQRIGDRGAAGRDDDPVPRRARRVPEAAVAGHDVDALAEAEGRQAIPGGAAPGPAPARSRSRGSPAPRGSPPGSPSRADVEDAVAGPDREQLRHAGHDLRLADRLAGADGEGLVRVRVAAPASGRRPRAGRRPSRRGRARRGCRGRGAGPRPSGPGPRSRVPGLVHRRCPRRAGLAAGLSPGSRRRRRRGGRRRGRGRAGRGRGGGAPTGAASRGRGAGVADAPAWRMAVGRLRLLGRDGLSGTGPENAALPSITRTGRSRRPRRRRSRRWRRPGR